MIVDNYGKNVVKINWSSVHGAISYNVQVKNEESGEIIYQNSHLGTSYAIIDDLSAGALYRAFIHANGIEQTKGAEKTKVFQVLPDSPLLKTVSDSDEDIDVYFTQVKGADTYVLAMFDQRMNPVTGINAFGILPSSHSGHVSFRKDQLVSGEVFKAVCIAGWKSS